MTVVSIRAVSWNPTYRKPSPVLQRTQPVGQASCHHVTSPLHTSASFVRVAVTGADALPGGGENPNDPVCVLLASNSPYHAPRTSSESLGPSGKRAVTRPPISGS